MRNRALNKNEGHKEGSFTHSMFSAYHWSGLFSISHMFSSHLIHVHMMRLAPWAFILRVVYANYWTWFFHVFSPPIWFQGQDHSAFRVVFRGNIEECSPFWTGLLQNNSQKATCQEEHRVLRSALSRAAPCLPLVGICACHWGCPAGALSFSLATL